MALDTATKRRAAAGVPFGIGVTPDSTHDVAWRFAVAWSYYPTTAAAGIPPITSSPTWRNSLYKPMHYAPMRYAPMRFRPPRYRKPF